MARFSIITTCKGRLSNLKLSLPQFVKQRDAEVVVVDYDCPDGTQAFVESHHPSVLVEKVTDKPKFNLPEARNIGANRASGDILVFIDADIVVGDDFLSRLNFPDSQMVYGVFVRAGTNSLSGSCIIRRQDFVAIDGYDDLLSGYGGEDLDIYMRLKNLGARRIELDASEIREVIEQSQDDRTRYRESDLQRDFLRGQLYQLAKETVLRTQYKTVIGLNFRRQIMAAVDSQIDDLFTGKSDFKLQLNLKDRYRRGFLADWEFSTKVEVNASRRKAN